VGRAEAEGAAAYGGPPRVGPAVDPLRVLQDEADAPVAGRLPRRHLVLVDVDAALVVEVEDVAHQPRLAGRRERRDAALLLPVEVEAPGGRTAPGGAGVDEAPAPEPPVLVGRPRLDPLVDDEELVEPVRPRVAPRERG